MYRCEAWGICDKLKDMFCVDGIDVLVHVAVKDSIAP